jgi:hypothetical protein
MLDNAKKCDTIQPCIKQYRTVQHQPQGVERNTMKTYEQLMQAYEKAADCYSRCKLGTVKHTNAGKKLDKAADALDQWRAGNKPVDSRSLAQRIADCK